MTARPEGPYEAARWREITTAPRDGTKILWCSDDEFEMHVIYWPYYRECFDSGWWQRLPVPPNLQVIASDGDFMDQNTTEEEQIAMRKLHR
jgi:hypothetical protein